MNYGINETGVLFQVEGCEPDVGFGTIMSSENEFIHGYVLAIWKLMRLKDWMTQVTVGYNRETTRVITSFIGK